MKTLGRGAYGKVKLCLDSQDHELYAIKIINNARSVRKGRALSKNRCVLVPPLALLMQPQVAGIIVVGQGDQC